jgi:hypothetical protein
MEKAKKISAKKMVLDALKAEGLEHLAKKIKSIRKDNNSLRVEGVNLFKSEREALDRFLGRYEHGTFNGMIDLYEYDREKPQQPLMFKYVFLSNEFEAAIDAAIRAKLANERDVTDDNSAMARMGCWYDQAIHRLKCELEGSPL